MTYQQKHLKNALLACITSLLASGLIACNQPAKNTAQTGNFCQIKTKPFDHTICQINSAELLDTKTLPYELRLFWREGNDNTNQNAKPLFTFNAINQQLQQTDQAELKFAVNAGMYNTDFAPIGYTVINGEQILSLNLKEGGGNFHLLPNGVFWWDKTGFYVTESKEMNKLLATGTKPIFATQSGPMLVIDGEIHPKFKPESTSKKIRNGVGICGEGNQQTIKFVTSSGLVNFYEFATLFKDELNCNNALFFDGGIASALYAPDINRHDKKNMGVIVGLVEQK